jgi:hypothetical protein
MVILLDIDGVMITTPSWKPTEQLEDGFLKFDPTAEYYLQQLLLKTNAAIILTSTHRISFPVEKWIQIFSNRGFHITSLVKINNKTDLFTMRNRAEEIYEWVNHQLPDLNYVIIDDDSSIHALPPPIKNRWVQTTPSLGFNAEASTQTLKILSQPSISNSL